MPKLKTREMAQGRRLICPKKRSLNVRMKMRAKAKRQLHKPENSFAKKFIMLGKGSMAFAIQNRQSPLGFRKRGKPESKYRLHPGVRHRHRRKGAVTGLRDALAHLRSARRQGCRT